MRSATRAADNHDVNAVRLVHIEQRSLESVGDANQRHDRGHGHGHAGDGQRRANAATRDVSVNQRDQSHRRRTAFVGDNVPAAFVDYTFGKIGCRRSGDSGNARLKGAISTSVGGP